MLYSIDDILQSADHSLNVSMVNHLLRNNNVTVLLQWPRETGTVYHVYVLPETAHTELTKTMSRSTIVISLTIPHNIQYNISIVSSLCGDTTTKVLHYGKYGIACSPTRIIGNLTEYLNA